VVVGYTRPVKQVSFGKYTLLHRIARGGMAELFLARSADVAGIERLCVIKLVSSHYAQESSFAAMFEDEVRIAASLHHPNIGMVLDVGHVAGHYYLAMELIHGKDLRSIVRRCLARGGPVPPAFAVQIAVRICSALEYAHNARAVDGSPLKIIHRDVSPSNIMVTYDGLVKLIDFGIAKAAGRSSLTLPGTIKGKIRYLSPEQIENKELDGRSDIFTLGTSLWEATVGRHLFGGSSPVEIYEAVVKGTAKPPSSFIADYPEGLERILLRALNKNHDQRYASARQMQQDLEQFAGSHGITLGELAISEFMGEMFQDEIQRWNKARASGQSLLDYLQSQADEVEHRHDLDDVLSLDDQKKTLPDTDPTAGPVPEIIFHPEAGEDDPDTREPRKTLMLGSPPTDLATAPRPVKERPRKTVLYGELVAPPLAPPPAAPVATASPASPPPAAPAAPPPVAPLPVANPLPEATHSVGQGPVVITPAGTIEPRPAADHADNRPTMLTGLTTPPVEQPPADAVQRPTIVEDWSNLGPRTPLPGEDNRPTVMEAGPVIIVSPGLDIIDTSSPTIAPDAPPPDGPAGGGPAADRDMTLDQARALAQPAASPRPEPRPHPDPVIAPDRAQLAAKRLEAEQSSPANDGRKRTRTGDWAFQATARGQERAGTHPFFKEVGPTPPVAGRTSTFMVHGGRRTMIMLLVIVLASVAVVATAWLVKHYRSTVQPTSGSTAPAAGTPAPAVTPKPAATVTPKPAATVTPPPPGRRVTLTSDPAGATVFDAQDGQELGRTPLVLDLAASAPRHVVLRLQGYKTRQVRLEGNTAAPIRLEPTPVHPPAHRPRPRPGKRQEELKEPFGR